MASPDQLGGIMWAADVFRNSVLWHRNSRAEVALPPSAMRTGTESRNAALGGIGLGSLISLSC